MKQLEYYYCEGCYWLKDDECLFRDAPISNFKCEIDEQTGLGKCNTRIKKDSEVPGYCNDCDWLENNECIFIDIIHSKFNCGLGKGYTQIKSKSSQLYPIAKRTKKDLKIPDYCNDCEWLENNKCVFVDTSRSGFKCEVEKAYWMKLQEINNFYKVLVIGGSGVGKRSLLNKFTTKPFRENYLSWTGVNVLKEVLNLGENITINLIFWDISGTVVKLAKDTFYSPHALDAFLNYRAIFNGADAMILIFDITRSNTFSNINDWYTTALNYGLNGIPCFLIGNKIDLKDDRKITLVMAKQLSKELKAPYFETSALTGYNVKHAFHKIAELIYSHLEFLFYDKYKKKWS